MDAEPVKMTWGPEVDSWSTRSFIARGRSGRRCAAVDPRHEIIGGEFVRVGVCEGIIGEALRLELVANEGRLSDGSSALEDGDLGVAVQYGFGKRPLDVHYFSKSCIECRKIIASDVGKFHLL